MNRIRNSLFIVSFMGLLCLSCEKKVATPPASATPAHTPKAIPVFQTNNGRVQNYSSVAKYEKNVLSISGHYVSGLLATDPFISDVKVSFYAKTTGAYVLSIENIGYTDWGWYYEGIRGVYQTDSVHIGFVNLTTLDTINHVASGTFDFVSGLVGGIPTGGSETDTRTGTFANITW